MESEINSPEKIGAFIRARRRKLKARQKDLAQISNTGLRFVVDVEKGKPTCQIGKVLILLQTLGIKVKLWTPDEE